jgi:hypothetical protein
MSALNLLHKPHPGISLLSKSGYKQQQRVSAGIRAATIEELETAITDGLPPGNDDPVTIYPEAVAITRQGIGQGLYNINLKFEDETLAEERRALYKTLGKICGKAIIPPRDLYVTIYSSRQPFQNHTIDALWAVMPTELQADGVVLATVTETVPQQNNFIPDALR